MQFSLQEHWMHVLLISCPYMWWFCVDNMEVVKYLLQLGCSVGDTNEAGHSALHIASHQGNTAMVDLLLRHGANPNAKTLTGATPLMIATKKRYIAVINVLKPVTNATGTITMVSPSTFPSPPSPLPPPPSLALHSCPKQQIPSLRCGPLILSFSAICEHYI